MNSKQKRLLHAEDHDTPGKRFLKRVAPKDEMEPNPKGILARILAGKEEQREKGY